MVTRIVSLVILVLLVGAPSRAQKNPCNPCGMTANTFYVNDARKRDTVTFRSEAPLEDIVGMSSAISGKINFDPTHPEQGATGTLTVSASSFATGIPSRDGHLAGEHWLNAAKYPDITLVVKSVSNLETVKKTDSAITFEGEATGDLTMNGKTNPVSFVARATYLKESDATKQKMPGNLLAVRAELNVSLASFDIKGPPGMGLIGSKVGEEITVAISVVGTTTAP